MIVVKDLTIETRQGRKLINNLSFALKPGDKIAIIGEEGNGKSTLLKAIYDETMVKDYCIISGKINKGNAIIGYLEQKLNRGWLNYTVCDFFLKSTLLSDFDYNIYKFLPHISSIFRSLDLNEKYLDDNTLIKYLSGGEQVKLQLAKIIFNKPDAILLDEPTNDLDISMLKKLEEFIINSQAAILYVSHDETLLEKTATTILHIEQLIKKTQPRWTLKKCSYGEYIENRKRIIDHQIQISNCEKRERNKAEEKLRHIKQKVENALVASKKNPSAGRIIAKKMASIKAQERKNKEKEIIEVPDVEEAIHLIFNPEIDLPSKKNILNLNNMILKIEDRILSQNINLNITGPRRIAIVGNNGCGKTTFLKKIYNILKDDKSLNVGYFSQDYSETLDYSRSAIEQFQSNSDLNPMTIMGSLKFTAEEMKIKINDLSEGQKAKLCLMKLIVNKNNVLILDEPTRNLSPLSNPVIRELLNNYNGAIIAVSHDRKFISDVCEKVYQLNYQGLTELN